MDYIQAYNNLKLKFSSGNAIPVERVTITCEEFEALCGDFESFKQSKLCPWCGSQIED